MALALPDPPRPGPIAVAYSGGLDSTVLLHALAARADLRARGLRALHVDHGLHPRSADWAAHCRTTCAGLGMDCTVLRVTVAPAGEGPEAAARAARYAALAAALREGELLAVAHHRDDQAETVLLRLLRASGDGLAGMRTLRPLGRGWLWRPLLGVDRATLAAEAGIAGLAWAEDPSNAARGFDRNFLRHDVMPHLARRWPGAAAALARSAGLLAVQADLLAGEDARRLAQAQGVAADTLSVPALLAESPPWRDRLLRAWLTGLGLPPLPAAGLDKIASELLTARPDARARFAWSGGVVERWRDLLHAGPAPLPWPEEWAIDWDGRAPLALPDGRRLMLDPAGDGFDAPLRVHGRRGGERLHQPRRDHSHELKHVLQDLGVPPWERARLPLLSAADGELLAAADLAVSARLQTWLDARGARLRWVR